MNKGFRGLLCLVLLLGALGPGLPRPMAAAPVESGVYEEDFSTYAANEYVEETVWDVWIESLRLSRLDAISQDEPAIAIANDGSATVVWVNGAGFSHTDIYAQRVDGNGNRLWATDVRVNSSFADTLGANPDTVESTNHSEALSEWDSLHICRSPDIAVDAYGNAFVVWHNSRDGHSDIYAQKLDSDGNRLWGSDIRVNSDSGTARQYDASVSVDGNGHAIIVWTDGRSDYLEIYAQKLGDNGNKLWGTDVRVNADIGPATRLYPAVAITESGNAVVVWTDYFSNIYGQKLNLSGERLWMEDVIVNSEVALITHSPHDVAVDLNGEAVVVWVDERNGRRDVYTQKLDTTGNRVWTMDVQINTTTVTVYQWASPRVSIDSQGNAVVVWSDQHNSAYVQKVNRLGNRLWNVEVNVSVATDASCYSPALALDTNNDVFVVCSSYRNGNTDIYAQKLNRMGNHIWTIDIRVNQNSGVASQESPAVAVDGNGNFIVVWVDKRDGNWDIYAQKLDGIGNRLWLADRRVNTTIVTVVRYSPAVTMDSNGNAVVVWVDYRNGEGWNNADIYAQRLDEAGNRLWASDMRVSVNTNVEITSQYSPDVAMDSNGNAIVVWEENRNDTSDIYAQKLDANGNKIWETDICVSSAPGMVWQHRPNLSIDGDDNTVIVWQDHRNDNSEIYAQKLTSAGNRLWADVRVNSSAITVWQTSPIVSVDINGAAVVAWRDANWKLYIQQLSESGSRMWTSDVHIVDTGQPLYLGGGGPSYDLVVAGENYLLVWEDSRNGNMDIYAQRLDHAGNKLWPSDLQVHSDSGVAYQLSPSLALNSDGSVMVVWNDLRNSNDDVYAQMISQTGERVWLADLQVVYPDLFYYPIGVAQSRTIDTLPAGITQATLTADMTLNGGGVQFSLTNNGGATWAAVTPGATHVFTTTGSDLRWRTVLTGDPVWRHRSPVVNSLRIEYSSGSAGGDDYEPDDTCAQASPIQVNGAAQRHTFHQYADSDWVWFDGQAGGVYTVQTSNTGPRADTVLELYDTCDEPPIDEEDNAFGPGATLTFTAPDSGRYYARVLQHDPNIYGADTDYDLSVRAQQPTGAAIIVAGRERLDDPKQPIIEATVDWAYQALLQGGFAPENILYLGTATGKPEIDDTPTKANVRDAIQDWARTRVGLGAPFWLYLADHGEVDRFHNEVGEVITAAELNLWLSNLEATSGVDQINVIIDACHSGSFIDTQILDGYGLDEITGHGRVVVASTVYSSRAYAPSGPNTFLYFSNGFWWTLGQGQSVWDAFLAGRTQVESSPIGRCGDYDFNSWCQRPWLDDTGDAWFDASDGLIAQTRGLHASFSGGIAPYIDWLTVDEVSAGQAVVRAQVRDDSEVTRVWARVFAPSFTPPESADGTIPVIEVPEVELTRESGDVFSVAYPDFTEAGVYQVVLYAQDDDGYTSIPRWVLVGEKKVYLPLVLRGK